MGEDLDINVFNGDISRLRGYYILLKNQIPVYVGMSDNVMSRVATHHKEGKKDFDDFITIKPDNKHLIHGFELGETILYLAFKPIYNDKQPPNPYIRPKSYFVKHIFSYSAGNFTKYVKKHDVQPIFGERFYLANKDGDIVIDNAEIERVRNLIAYKTRNAKKLINEIIHNYYNGENNNGNI